MAGRVFIYIGSFVLFVVAILFFASAHLSKTYNSLASPTIYDRHGQIIFQDTNAFGTYNLQREAYPESLKRIVLQKEDQFFYIHPGINPLSIIRAATDKLHGNQIYGASTITQQLVKVLKGNESERTLKNKIIESLLAVGLELRYSKNTLLTMYLNTVHLGNQAQGFAQASEIYFGKPIDQLSDADLLLLVATLSNPSAYNPWTEMHTERTALLAEQFDISLTNLSTLKNDHFYNSPTAFEVNEMLTEECMPTCHTTIDAHMTEQIRGLVHDHVRRTAQSGGTELAVVVIDATKNEIVSLVGSHDPFGRSAGSQINMAVQPRPIGSTIKPFIYAEAFEHDARPYSLVTDQEYKYPIGTGFSLYPKNFDGQYYGDVTLQHALGNSLNTPSITLLEYITLTDFYELLEADMGFTSINPLSSYAYGIALGGLEMDLLTLTHYFTTFPREGVLSPLFLTSETSLSIPQNTIKEPVKLFEPHTVELLNSILTERTVGAQQFGIQSHLDTSFVSAVKTGTSRDFHDSWTIGYTPDFVVGVWVGNAENTPLTELSGSVGAGPLWRQVMELLAESTYNQDSHFTYDHVVTYNFDQSSYYGLPNDDTDYMRNFLLPQNLITTPHNDDVIALQPDTSILLSSREPVTWFVNDTLIRDGAHVFWKPDSAGVYTISAQTADISEERTVTITDTTLWEVP